MTSLTVTNNWQLVTVPCVFQVRGARVGIYFGESVPTSSSPQIILQNFDFWEHSTSMPLYIKTVDNYPESISEIITSPIP